MNDVDKPESEYAPVRVCGIEASNTRANRRIKLTDWLTAAAANLHHARTVCRRAEIAVLQLAEKEQINPQIAIYLNRLSDLLFVLARVCNNNGEDDVLWTPGKSSD